MPDPIPDFTSLRSIPMMMMITLAEVENNLDPSSASTRSSCGNGSSPSAFFIRTVSGGVRLATCSSILPRGYRMSSGRSTVTINSIETESIAQDKGVLMPPVNVDPAKVKTFENAIAFYDWLSAHHHEEDDVWIIQAANRADEPARRRTLARAAQGSASLLGFEDPNSFFRTFHRWTGSTSEPACVA
jgi:hypothetical protein